MLLFPQKSSIIYDRPASNVPPIEGAVNVASGWTASVWNLQSQAGVQ